MHTVCASTENRKPLPHPLLLLSDLRYPSLLSRRSAYQGELQTARDLYLAEVLAHENPNHRVAELSIIVSRASDGSRVTYGRIKCKMRLRKDGSCYHRISVPAVGGYETQSEAIAAILAHAAGRREGQVAM